MVNKRTMGSGQNLIVDPYFHRQPFSKTGNLLIF